MRKLMGCLSFGVAAQEKQLLMLAAQNGGVLTVAMVCANSALTIDESEEALDRMAKRSVADLEIDENGVSVYRFIGLLPAKR